MSSNNRERVRLEMQKQNSKSGTIKWVAITIGILVVIGGIAFGLIKATQSNAPDYSSIVQPSVIQDKGIIVGEGKKIVEKTPEGVSNVTIYQDYICPGCKSFEESYASEIDKILTDGVGTIEYRTLGMLDSMSAGTNYSSRAANVALCSAVDSPDSFYELNKIFYANQPAEGSSGLKNKELVTLANSVGVGDISKCVEDGTYRGFVKKITESAVNDDKIAGTPTVLVNGEKYELGSAKGLYDTVVEENKNLANK